MLNPHISNVSTLRCFYTPMFLHSNVSTPDKRLPNLENNEDNLDNKLDSNSTSQGPSAAPEPMNLLPPPERIYNILDEAKEAVESWAVPQGYDIFTSKSNRGKQPHLILRCDCACKTVFTVKDENRKRYNHSYKKTDCKFECYVSCPKALKGRCQLRVKNSTHNHPLPISVLPRARVASLKQHKPYVVTETAADARLRQLANSLLARDPRMRLKEKELDNLRRQIRIENLNGE